MIVAMMLLRCNIPYAYAQHDAFTGYDYRHHSYAAMLQQPNGMHVSESSGAKV
jgi:hypothetical protein